jgi:hypothetical protein
MNINLFNGEVFSYNKKEENTVQMSDEEINEKYRRGDVRIVTEQARYPIDSIENMLDSGKYKLNPEYQRRKRWDTQRKSRLIESFIMNVPLPPIFLYEYEYSKYEVMDGLQRLTSIYEFYKNKFALEGLEYWTELNGRHYKDLPIKIKEGIDRRYISSIVLLEETAKTPEEAEALKQIVFERLNSGGEKLTPQETRNALYNGKFNQLCIKLAENDKFKKMWNIESTDNAIYKKMEDVELVLRFFAYRFIEQFKHTKEKFFDDYLKKANTFDLVTLKKLENLFNDTIDLTWHIFEKDAFILPKNERQNKRPTTVIYDPLMQVFSQYIDNKSALINKKEEIKNIKTKEIHQALADNGKLLFDGKYDHKPIVIQRINYFDNKIKDIIKANE